MLKVGMPAWIKKVASTKETRVAELINGFLDETFMVCLWRERNFSIKRRGDLLFHDGMHD